MVLLSLFWGLSLNISTLNGIRKVINNSGRREKVVSIRQHKQILTAFTVIYESNYLFNLIIDFLVKSTKKKVFFRFIEQFLYTSKADILI